MFTDIQKIIIFDLLQKVFNSMEFDDCLSQDKTKIFSDGGRFLACISENQMHELSDILSKLQKEVTTNKSKAASMVLQLMDKDFSYQAALSKILLDNPNLNKEALENELNIYC